MPRTPSLSLCCLLLVVQVGTLCADDSQQPQADVAGFKVGVAPLFKQYCIDCHGPDVQEANLDLTSIDPDLLTGDDLETWRLVDEQLRFADMPPEDESQPSAVERATMLKWLRGEMLKSQQPGVVTDQKLLLPQYGNYVDHDALFNEPAGPVIPASPRIWRMRPEIYDNFARGMTEGLSGQSQPFTMSPAEGIKDFDAAYYIDEPSTDLLLRNAQLIIDNQTGPRGKWRDVKRIVDPETKPTREQIIAAIGQEYQLSVRRNPTEEEIERYLALYDSVLEKSGYVIGGKAMLMAIVMQPEAVFRLELGQGPVDEHGRRRLSQREIAIALSYSLGSRVDSALMSAADKDELASAEQIESQIQKLLENPKADTSRIMQFFREYFGYRQATEVFKDSPQRGKHEPGTLVSDLEFLIEDILAEDKDVFYELLTTNRAYVNLKVDKKRGTRSPARHGTEFETVYGLPPDWKWTGKQPIELPSAERAGVLTHPAWLVAWSGNFDNHPVQRGKWVRTHLLGGTVPDVPIGVDARIPEDEHKTLRERLVSTTSAAECWRCHRKMDPLGLPFEKYTHYGHGRRFELDKPVDTTGTVTRTGDKRVDGQVEDPVKMMHHLARSERAEQVFVRHAFRFFLGRNESLGDAKTLQDAHNAYKQSGGSFNALIVQFAIIRIIHPSASNLTRHNDTYIPFEANS